MKDNLALRAMKFAQDVHKDQRRKYTENPYFDHLAEVAGIVATATLNEPDPEPDLHTRLAVAWLHDSMEDQGVTRAELVSLFGLTVAMGVELLSDMEEGNRQTRKRLSRERLAQAPGWIQTIKVADLISNASSIVEHDPRFARTYLQEKAQQLEVMTNADPQLLILAWEQVDSSREKLKENGPNIKA